MSDRPRQWEDPRTVLKRHGLAPKRSWGQNFLVNRAAVDRIAERCVDEPGRHVVEIGAGLGTLTTALLAKGARVTAVERDLAMCGVLEAELGGHPGFSLVSADAATVDYAALLASAPGVVAGNLPYQITGRILRRVLTARMPLLRAVFMIQEEVADRLVAAPGDKARAALSAMTQTRCGVLKVLRLGPTSFWPVPKVRSAVVELTPIEPPLFGALDAALFDAAVKAAFSSRRKMIKNSLLSVGAWSPVTVLDVLARAQIPPNARAEQLTNEELAALAAAAAETGTLLASAQE